MRIQIFCQKIVKLVNNGSSTSCHTCRHFASLSIHIQAIIDPFLHRCLFISRVLAFEVHVWRDQIFLLGEIDVTSLTTFTLVLLFFQLRVLGAEMAHRSLNRLEVFIKGLIDLIGSVFLYGLKQRIANFLK